MYVNFIGSLSLFLPSSPFPLQTHVHFAIMCIMKPQISCRQLSNTPFYSFVACRQNGHDVHYKLSKEVKHDSSQPERAYAEVFSSHICWHPVRLELCLCDWRAGDHHTAWDETHQYRPALSRPSSWCWSGGGLLETRPTASVTPWPQGWTRGSQRCVAAFHSATAGLHTNTHARSNPA